MTLEHHRDLAHEFPELKQRVHDLKIGSAEFRHLYAEYAALDNEIYRIEQEIETPSDTYTEDLKHRRAHFKDRLYALLTGRLHLAADTEEYVVRHKLRVPVDQGEVTRGWREQGYSCEIRNLPPGSNWLGIANDGEEMLAVVDGGLAVEIHDACYLLAPGDEMFIPRETSYRLRNPSAQETHWLYGHAIANLQLG